MLGPVHPDSIGEGIGYLMILRDGVPYWLLVLAITPFLANLLFADPILGKYKRIAFMAFLPIMAAALITAILFWTLHL
jgi:hypothetical protein